MADNFMQTKTSSATAVLEPSATQADGLVHFLNENFTAITDVEEIAQFVRSHPGVEETLRESLPIVKGIFGDVKPLLIVSQGFEDAVDDYLSVLIPSGDDIEEAFRKLGNFRDWWYQAPLSSMETLFFDLKMI